MRASYLHFFIIFFNFFTYANIDDLYQEIDQKNWEKAASIADSLVMKGSFESAVIRDFLALSPKERKRAIMPRDIPTIPITNNQVHCLTKIAMDGSHFSEHIRHKLRCSIGMRVSKDKEKKEILRNLGLKTGDILPIPQHKEFSASLKELALAPPLFDGIMKLYLSKDDEKLGFFLMLQATNTQHSLSVRQSAWEMAGNYGSMDMEKDTLWHLSKRPHFTEEGQRSFQATDASSISNPLSGPVDDTEITLFYDSLKFLNTTHDLTEEPDIFRVVSERKALNALRLLKETNNPSALFLYAGKQDELELFSSTKELLSIYLAAADLGHMEAQYEAGCILIGFEDRKKICKYFKLAADQGHMEAKRKLALEIIRAPTRSIYTDDTLEEYGASQQKYEAYEMLLDNSKKGHIKSKILLADILAYGIPGFLEKDHIDYNELYKLYEEIEESGHIHYMSKSYLGRMLESGLYCPKDEERACKLYREAARSGDPHEQYDWGRMLMAGKYGVTKNIHLAFKCFQQASKVDSNAMYELGLMYLNGIGCKKNKDLGLRCLKKASEKYHLEAKILYESLIEESEKKDIITVSSFDEIDDDVDHESGESGDELSNDSTGEDDASEEDAPKASDLTTSKAQAAEEDASTASDLTTSKAQAAEEDASTASDLTTSKAQAAEEDAPKASDLKTLETRAPEEDAPIAKAEVSSFSGKKSKNRKKQDTKSRTYVLPSTAKRLMDSSSPQPIRILENIIVDKGARNFIVDFFAGCKNIGKLDLLKHAPGMGCLLKTTKSGYMIKYANDEKGVAATFSFHAPHKGSVDSLHKGGARSSLIDFFSSMGITKDMCVKQIRANQGEYSH